METVATKFTLSQKIRDDVFDVDLISQYILNLQVGNDSFRFCVVDSVFKKCLWVEDYNFPAVFSPEQLIEQVSQIYDEHQILRAGFWKEIKLSFRNQYFTLIPEILFKSKNSADYLKLSTGLFIPSTDIFNYRHIDYQLINIFSADNKTINWFKTIYTLKEIKIVHQNSAFIEGIMQQKLAQTDSKMMFISVEKTLLTIYVLKDKKPEYCNTFTFQNEQDFVYYVMLTMDGLQLNPDDCKVMLFGEIVESSSVFNNLFKYVRNVCFGNRPTHLRFSYRFDDAIDHRYFDLYNIYLCE